MNTATPVLARTLGFVLLLLAALTNTVVATPVGETWVRRSQLPTGEQLSASALNDLGTCVVVGNHGTILTSTTGTSWTIRDSGVADDLQDVIWMGSRFLAVGYNGTILWSVDGSTWTKTPTVDAAFTTVTWTGSLAVAVGGTYNKTTRAWSGAIFMSPDGLTWTRQTVTGAPYFFAVGWNGSVIAAAGNGTTVGSGAVYTSTNGTSWTKRVLPNHVGNANNTVSSITSMGGTFLLTGAGAWTSSNGTTWTLQSGYDFLIGMMVRWTGSEFVATHRSGLFYTSATGGSVSNWADRSGGLLAPPLGGGRVGSNLIVLSYGGHIGRQAAASLGTWTSSHTLPRAFSVKGLAHNGSLYVAVGGDMSWTSTDGSTWTSYAQTSFNARSVTWDGTQFIAAGNGAWTSTNGSTWTNTLTPDSSGTSIFFNAFTALGKVIISGYNSSGSGASYSAISTDHGATWSAASMPFPCLAMSVNGSTIIGVGWYGSVMTSTTGTTWTLDNAGLPSGDDFTAMTFAGGQFVAGTKYGNIYTSATGVSWTFRDVVPSAVTAITRTTNEYIIIGDRGLVARSFDGFYWRVLDTFTSVDLARLNWDGTRLVTAADEGNFFTSEGTAATRTEVAINASSPTMAETGGTAQITVSLPAAWPIDVAVPLAFSGTAVKDTDYTVPANFIVIPKGSTSASLTLTAKADLTDETNESIIVTALAPTGDVILGSTVTDTVTITDDDTKPTFGTPMADQLVAVGTPFVFSAPATGSSAISYQWKKNTASISGAKSSSYSVNKAALTHAGEYAVEAKNLSGTVVGSTAKLGVVTVVNKVVTQKTGTTGTFLASAAGAVSYHWKRGTTYLTDGGNITGSTTPKLVIIGMVPTDTAVYACDVTMGSLTMTSSTYDFGIIDNKPIITVPSAMIVRVSQSIDLPVSATNRPSSWKISNLPAGLQYSPTTGRITGKPTAVTAKTVTLTTTNLYGPSDNATFGITVEALPSNTLGSFVALLPRNAVNQNLGGRLDVTTTPNGRYTGKLWNGGDSYTLDTYLNGDRLNNPTGYVHIVRPAPLAALDLNFSIDLMTGGLTASVTDGSTTATGTGQPRVAATTNRTGAYNIALSPVTGSPSGTPEGHSYAQFTIASSGSFNAVGKLADNTAFTIATQIAADGSIPLFLSLYSGKGSIHGGLTLHEDAASSYANNFLTGSTTWLKTNIGSGRSYASGFPLFIQVADGGRYAKHTSGIVMNLTAGAGNAQVHFTGANLSTASRNPDGDFTVASIAAVTKPVPNVAGTTLVFDTTKGLVSGQFILSDTDTSVLPNKTLARTVPYNGIIIRPSGLPAMKAFGYFNLAQMPTAMPKTTSTTSPQLSGAVMISPP